MRLKEWFRNQKLIVKQFARKIDVSRSQAHKYIYEGAIPRPEVMLRIFVVTDKAVTPNDFYGVTLTIDEIKEQDQGQRIQYEDYENVKD